MGHHHHVHSTEPAPQRRLLLALWLIGGFALIEAAAGFWTGSLALLSDAGHMVTDAGALGIALLAIRLGRKRADGKRTFGYRRFEILAAALNALILLLIAGFILYEAWQRFSETTPIATGPMFAVAVMGLLVNLIGLRLLHGSHHHSLNVKGAYLEVLADTLGSIGVIAAALVIHFTGWRVIDPIVAILIGLWVLPRAVRLLSESLHVLLEGVPEGVALSELQAALRALPTVQDVHELHVWSITSGQHSLSAHLRVSAYPVDDRLLHAAQAIAARYHIRHTNFQIELHCGDAPAACIFTDDGPPH